ncbi:hypothetical protein V6N11_016684 [Hibiscus sabdariffa]|uniref:Uncharacterized protein n=1 Tax=Hibiscus sabdariffa TaxID=183260 RepID=A0ABR2TVX0_9ROSI
MALAGEFPVEIVNLRNVDGFLKGFISEGTGELEDVAYLSLAGNGLQGSIPELIGGLRGLHFLHLSRNNFSGTIPKSLERLLDLEYFNVSFNRLHGEIPRQGPFANYSIRSFMGNAELCGGETQLQLPPCKTNLSSKKPTKLLLHVLLPTGSTLLMLALIFLFLLWRRRRKTKLPIDRANSDALADWRRIPYHELRQATDGFCESKLLGVGSFGSVYQGQEDSVIQTITLATIGYMAPGMEVIDTNLLSISNEQEKAHNIASSNCALSALQLALDCSHELPEERIDMKQVVAQLNKIKFKFLNESNEARRSVI